MLCADIAGKMAWIRNVNRSLLLNGPGVVRKMKDSRGGTRADLRLGVVWACSSLRCVFCNEGLRFLLDARGARTGNKVISLNSESEFEML